MSAPQKPLRAVYMRGGTSRALIFHARDLPPCDPAGDRTGWDAVFTAALGSPDSNMRQLDGMGGGISSLSKVAVVAPPTHPEADVDYTFAQIGIDRPTVGYKGNCGNISAAIGPFAVDEGLVQASGDLALVRIHNTNTGKIILARFPLQGGQSAVKGDCRLDGVAGSGAPIRLDFLDPGGAATGKLFPTGRLRDQITLASGERAEVTLIDAANPLVVIAAQVLGLEGEITPETLAGDAATMARLVDLRRKGAVIMGLAEDEAAARDRVPNLPLIAIVSPGSEGAALTVRLISADQPHKATPLTGAMALAAAARIHGTVAAELASAPVGDQIRLAHAGGQIDLTADVVDRGVDSLVRSAGVMRTARRLMAGEVYIPA